MSTRPMRRRPADLVQDIMDIGARHLVEKLAVSEDAARSAMRVIAHGVCERNAKCMIYVPEDAGFELMERDTKIWEAYQIDGPGGAKRWTNERIEQLAADHGLSIQQVYNVVRRQKRLELAARQPVLPGIEPAE